MTTYSDTVTDEEVVVLTAQAIATLAAKPLGEDADVRHRVLWTRGTSSAGVLQIPAGHRLGLHTHRVNHHHFWLLDGHAVVLGRALGPGSYVHVPSGVEHDVDATGTDGCTVFYLYAAD